MEIENKPVQNFPAVDGGSIQFSRTGSSGFFQNPYGVGDISLDLTRSDGEWRYIDLGCIYFAAPTADQVLDASLETKNISDIKRRLSKKQADLVTEVILKAIDTTFKGGIPADENIDQFRKNLANTI